MRTRTFTSRFRRTALTAILAAAVLTGCVDEPLQGVGERSGEWIGPLAEEMVLLPGN